MTVKSRGSSGDRRRATGYRRGMAPINPANGKGTYEIRIDLWATEEQAFEVQERLTRALCLEPDHEGPCAMPWSSSVVPPEAVDEHGDHYEELVTQAKVEGTY